MTQNRVHDAVSVGHIVGGVVDHGAHKMQGGDVHDENAPARKVPAEISQRGYWGQYHSSNEHNKRGIEVSGGA